MQGLTIGKCIQGTCLAAESLAFVEILVLPAAGLRLDSLRTFTITDVFGSKEYAELRPVFAGRIKG